MRPSDPVACAYDVLASGYDVLTQGHPNDVWLGSLERLARENGLSGKRALDVACGTGESFLPLLSRGYEITGCDLSLRMLELARVKAPGVSLHQADMRELPRYGEFDLILCVDDGLNYVEESAALRSCFEGFVRNLAPDGVAVWDLNTVHQYRSQFAEHRVVDGGSVYLGWRGPRENGLVDVGGVVEVAIDVFEERRDHLWERRTSKHRQRHWPMSIVSELAESAGLHVVTTIGQSRGARLGGTPDEYSHSKVVYVACKQQKGGRMIGDP